MKPPTIEWGRRWSRPAAVLLGALALASSSGCTAAVQPHERAELRLLCYLCDQPNLDPSAPLRVTVTQGQRHQAFTRRDFQRLQEFPTPQITVPTRTDGTIEVEVEFESGVVRAELIARGDWRWDVLLFVGGLRPGDPPGMGEMGRAFAPLPQRGDTLLITWGGNSISSPVVY